MDLSLFVGLLELGAVATVAIVALVAIVRITRNRNDKE